MPPPGRRAASPRRQKGGDSLITGDNGAWTSYGGLLAGDFNQIKGPFDAIPGGRSSTASGFDATVAGPGPGPQAPVHSGLGSQRKRRTATRAPIAPQAARMARCRQSAPVCRASGPVSASLNGRTGSQPVTWLSNWE